ncbi:hypothetical protein Vadar_001119 [Vaccinium darrowii]|uniref:Uncharacterized protein n=1 Tax=Vaccinium darrowii TaxID=229202 RepID=A0ACB7WWJ5_9ERIC|nr:hypothetical protein Vadar_001119 [Vaccinium darrowii]
MMEFLGTVFEFVKIIKEGWEIMKNIIEFYGYYSGLEESMQNLKRKVECLSAQENDINTQITRAEHRPWTKRKIEAEVWLRDVQRVKDDVQILQEVDGERNFFLHLRLRKRIIKKIQEVEKLQEKGRAFNDLLVDEFPIGKLLMPLMEDIVVSTEARNVERVWECLMNDEDRRIGVFGMGGVGKTTIMKHIHNRLLEEAVMFDAVFWVTVSKPFNITNLQSDISKELNFSLSDDKDVTRRAKQLQAVLRQQKKYVLIIDDLWESFPLEEVGIPEQTRSNGCKLVLATRSFEVCRRMGCKAIKVELLTEHEALTLFRSKASENGTSLASEVENFATQIAKECARLPLAIVTVAGSLRGLKRTRAWRNALNELTRSTKDANNGESEVFERLKFSYIRLGEKVLQDCFLYCSLYPEDHAIPAEELIERWIVEELIVGINSVETMFDKGHDILRKLTSSCLLESFTDELAGECVRMHDLIRDMALRMTKSSPRFMVKASERQESIPDEDWSEDLEKISFMYSQMRELSTRPPVCPRLTTLLLNGILLQEIPDSFFTYMRCLKVLDLSDNKINSLPRCISNLENLHALILASCYCLMYVPSLEKLKALKVLILTGTLIEEVPEGIEDLVNLTKLDLSNNLLLRMFPSWKLRRLSKLQFLRMDGTEVYVIAEDLLFFRELKIVSAQFHDVNGLNRYVTSQNFQGLERYRLLVGGSILREPFDGKEVGINCRSEPFGSGVSQLVLPTDTDFFLLEEDHDLTSLSAIPSLKHAKGRCVVRLCNGLESIFSSSPFLENGQISLRTVKSLVLAVLPRFRVLFDGIALPHKIYFHLKDLTIRKCEILKNIFPLQFLQNFPNLEKLSVCFCENVEDIIVEIEEVSDGGNHQDDSNSISLPKLERLELEGLPSLKSIYNGVTVCQSIEEVMVLGCPMLRRLPLSLHVDSEQATAPPALKDIKGEQEWWESLEWDDQLTKTILQPFFRDYS